MEIKASAGGFFSIDDALVGSLLGHDRDRFSLEIKIYIAASGVDTVAHHHRIPVRCGIDCGLNGGVIPRNVQSRPDDDEVLL